MDIAIAFFVGMGLAYGSVLAAIYIDIVREQDNKHD